MVNRLHPVRRDDRGVVVALVCTKCLEEKDVAEFHRSSTIKHGFRMPCKACQRVRRAELQRAYNRRHPEKVKAGIRKWHEQNPDYERERAKRRWREDPRVRERVRIASRRHAKEHPEYYALKAHERRTRDRAAGKMVTPEQWAHIIFAYGERCVFCERDDCKLTVEHLQPVSRGGTHAPANLAPACKPCNSRKKDRTVEEFLGGQLLDSFAAKRTLALPRIALEMGLI